MNINALKVTTYIFLLFLAFIPEVYPAPSGGVAVTATMLYAGDGNGDGCVDAADYTTWANNFGKTVGPDEDPFALGDYNFDGEVGAADYTVWANNFGTGCG